MANAPRPLPVYPIANVSDDSFHSKHLDKCVDPAVLAAVGNDRGGSQMTEDDLRRAFPGLFIWDMTADIEEYGANGLIHTLHPILCNDLIVWLRDYDSSNPPKYTRMNWDRCLPNPPETVLLRDQTLSSSDLVWYPVSHRGGVVVRYDGLIYRLRK